VSALRRREAHGAVDGPSIREPHAVRDPPERSAAPDRSGGTGRVRPAIAQHPHATLGERFVPPHLPHDKAARGEPGRNSGQGFHTLR
jgi:hypothetical protein